MSKESVIIGAYSAIYIGDYNSSSPLSELGSNTTGPFRVAYAVPEDDYLESVDGPLQNDRARLDVDVELLDTSVEAKLLALGNLPSSTGYRDELPASSQQSFSVLLVHSSDTEGNIYIPRCFVKKVMNTSADKSKPSTVPIKFYATDRNRHNKLYYERSLDDLSSIMLGKYPF